MSNLDTTVSGLQHICNRSPVTEVLVENLAIDTPVI